VSGTEDLEKVAPKPEEGTSAGEQSGETPLHIRARRSSGARSPVSEVVSFRAGDKVLGGWALNMSRGGLRAALEEAVAVGSEWDVTVGDTDETHRGRIVWVRSEKDGCIVGVSFLDADEAPPPESE
jgi:PilZ domain-containing protein